MSRRWPGSGPACVFLGPGWLLLLLKVADRLTCRVAHRTQTRLLMSPSHVEEPVVCFGFFIYFISLFLRSFCFVSLFSISHPLSPQV